MTTKRTYTCNLCMEGIAPTGENAGFGLHWVGTFTTGAYTFIRVADSERHICLSCAQNVRDELRKVTPDEPVAAIRGT